MGQLRLAIAFVSMGLVAGCVGGEPIDEEQEGFEDVGSAGQALSLPPAPSDSTCLLLQRGTLGTCDDSDISAQSPDFDGSAYPYSWTGGSPLEHKSLFQFGLDPIPPGADITLATFNVQRAWNEDHSTVRVRRVTAPWGESNVTWNSMAGGLDSAVLATFDPYDVGFTTVEVTDLVRGWVGGEYPNHGLALEEDIDHLHSYTNSEASTVSNRPSLYVCFKGPVLPQPPAGSTCKLIRRGTLGDCDDSDISDEAPDFNGSIYPYSWTGGSPLEHKSLFEFDLSPIPAGANVTLAAFSVRRLWSDVHSTVRMRRVTTSWNESNVTWNHIDGSFDSTILATFDPYDTGFTTLDVTDLARGWVTGEIPNQGIALEEDIENLHGYANSEASTLSDRPSLYVCYDDPGEP